MAVLQRLKDDAVVLAISQVQGELHQSKASLHALHQRDTCVGAVVVAAAHAAGLAVAAALAEAASMLGHGICSVYDDRR